VWCACIRACVDKRSGSVDCALAAQEGAPPSPLYFTHHPKEITD
jgi:hypothetical protein